MEFPQPQKSPDGSDLAHDYISNLPEELKQKILTKLPTEEAVRTSILSSQWKNSWVSIPELQFRGNCTQSRFIKLVENVLSHHHGPIEKFKLRSSKHELHQHGCDKEIGQWLDFLSRNGIKEIDLDISCCGQGFEIPSSFFSCLTLEHVRLSQRCRIYIPQLFEGFQFLRTLRLKQFNSEGSTIEKLVSSSPLLHNLELSGTILDGCLMIRSPKLNRLNIFGDLYDLCLGTPELEHMQLSQCSIHIQETFQVFQFVHTLKLIRVDLKGTTIEKFISSCPLLENMELIGFVEESCLVIQSQSLKRLSISGDFYDLCLDTPKLVFLRVVLNNYNHDYEDFSMAKDRGESNILLSLGQLSEIQELKICFGFCAYLAIGLIPETLPVTFSCLNDIFVHFNSFDKGEVTAALCLIQNAPNLKSLSLEYCKVNSKNLKSHDKTFCEVKRSHDFLFKCLETLKILRFEDAVLDLLEFVLNIAPMLEKLVVKEKSIVYLEDIWE